MQLVHVNPTAQTLPTLRAGNAATADPVGHLSQEAERHGALPSWRHRFRPRPGGSTAGTVEKLVVRAISGAAAPAAA